MLLEISFISFILFNYIQASVTFSQSYVRNNPIFALRNQEKWSQHQKLFNEKRNVYSSVLGSSSTSLYDLRGGGGDEEKEEDEVEVDDILPPSLRELVEDTISSQRKIIVVTGGVLSGIGKGVTASSIGVLLRAMGLRITALKIDPYLNVDAGTMSPFEHGEVFVLDDGGETDLDLGNYERFLSVSLTKDSNLSTGKIYQVCLIKFPNTQIIELSFSRGIN